MPNVISVSAGGGSFGTPLQRHFPGNCFVCNSLRIQVFFKCIFPVKEDYRYQTSIKDREFDNEWFKLEKDGKLIIKGSYKKGYAWDGCTPKIKIKDVYFGIPEGVLNFETGKSKPR